MRKETIKTLQGDCHENEKNNEIGGPNNSIKKRNERIIEAYQTENTSIAGLAERFGVSKRTIGNVTHSLKEQNLQQQSLTNETTKEKEESNNQNIEAYLAGDLWVSKLVNKFNGSARTILMKIKKAREQKEEMQYKTSSENEILQLDRNSFEQREELVKQQELISEVLLKDELEQVHPAQPRSLEDKVISLRKQKSVDHDSQSKKYNLNDSSSRKRKMQENKDPEKFSLSAFPIDKNSLKTSSVKPKKPKKSYVLHEVEEYSPKLSQISKQIHTTENEHLIDENQQDKLQGIGPQQNKNFSSSLPLPNKLEEATSSENHIFNSKQVQVTGSHLRENQEEHPILSETEGEFGNSLFDSLSDFDYSNESNEERSFFQKSANLSDELSNHNLTTEEIVEALMEFDETLDSAKNLVDYVNGSNELPKQSNNDLFEDSSNDSLTTEEIVEALMEVDETLDSAKNLVDYVNGSNELAKQSNNDLFDDSSNDSLTTEEIVEALVEVDETLDSAKNLVDYVNGSNELPKQSNNDLFEDLSNDSLTTDEIVEALMEIDETLDPAKNLVDYVNGSNELAKQSNNDLFDDSSNDSLTTDEIVEALVEVDETLDSAKNLVDYVNGSNELPKQSNNDLFEDLSNDSLTTDEIVEALMEIDETLDPAKNLVDYVNGSNELPKQSNNDLFDDSSNDSLMTEEITEILMRFDETLNSGKKPMKYVMELSERQESNKLFDESSNSQQVEYPIMEQTMAGKAVNQPGSENNQVNFIEDQNQEYLIDEEKHPQNPHNIHNDRGTGEFIQKKQDKSIKNSENTPVNQNQETALDEERHPKRAAAHLSENLHSIQNLESNLGHQTTKQTDKQTIPQTGYILDPVLPQNVTKNNYLEYIQLYQSIQSTIKIETFCDIMKLSQDTFQELLKEAVPAESTNSELGYIENKREIIPREYKLEKINLYLNSQHSYESKRQFCDKNNLDYDSFRSWIREHKKGELPRQSISTIEELISREQDGRNLYCTAKVKKACVLLWRSKRIAHKVLCKKLNISDATLRTWNNRYDQARGKKQELITTLTELKERKLKLGKLCCTEEVKRECVLLYKNQEMSIEQLCKIYHLTPNTVNAWIEEYDRLLQNSERTSQARQTFSTNVGNAKFTTADNNARLAHEQGKSQGNQRMQHSIQNLESNLGDQTTKQTDKQLNPPARHSLDPVLPQKVNQSYTKNDYLKYIQLYQSIQTTIKIETFCDIMKLSQDTFQELLKEAVSAESTNSELGYIENKREIIPREYKLEKINLYLNSQHSYKSKRQFCDKNNLDYSSFSSWIKEHKKGNLTRKSISTIEELISRERNGRNLDCTAKVKEACVLLWRGCSMTKTELSNKLNINDMVVRSWEDRYNRAHGNEQKKIITTLSELENRDLKFRYLSCTEKVKKECILLLNDTKNTKGRICQKYHLNVKTFYNWYNKYKLLLNGAEKDSKERQTFSTNVGNAKITAADNNARLANEQNKSPNLFLGNQKIQ
ncbi:transposase [Enterococcus sp. DIV1421a]|uniref:transposase n=1 Tax=Enterococcus sp. DIV1421a TaxID=2774813 RepID=UPI003F1FAC6C